MNEVDKENIVDEDYIKKLNEAYGYQNILSEGFTTDTFHRGIVEEYTPEQLIKFFSNPQRYNKELETVAEYYYTTNGDIFQQFDLAKVLPSLNYKIQSMEKTANYENHCNIINFAMKQINHKEITRDLITQLISSGTVCGMWLGNKKNPYLYIFDNLEYIFPAYRKNGKWCVWVDLAWFDTMGEAERINEINNLNPYVTMDDYNTFKEDPSKIQFIELPIERSIVLRTHTLKRNQRFGLTWVAQSMYDVLHKKKLKDLEKAVANKIINSVAVLTIGDKENPNLNINKNLKRTVYRGVKSALEKNSKDGVTCVAIPEFAKLDFAESNSEPLDPKKFNSIDSDISNATGISRTMTSGVGGNFASGKMNYEIVYKRISVILEDIENEVYAKLLKVILPKTFADKYEVIYDKKPPLSQGEQLEVLMKLHSEGFGIKPIIDMLDGVEFDDYIEQSLYELEVMELHDKIKPYQTAHTMSNKDGVTPKEASIDDVANVSDNENTNKSQSGDGNNTPDTL